MAAAKNVHLNRLINIISQLGLFLADGQLRFGARGMNIIKVNYNWEKPWANISTAGTRGQRGRTRGGEEEGGGGKGEKTEGNPTFFV